MIIGKDFSFDAAHRLQLHNGKCRSLHGHTYRVSVSAEGNSLAVNGPDTGMLFDFGVLSEWWKAVDAVLDHATILEEGDPLIAAISSVSLPGQKFALFPWPPTAEHLAIWIRNDLMDSLLRHGIEIHNVHVRVYETTKSWAEA